MVFERVGSATEQAGDQQSGFPEAAGADQHGPLLDPGKGEIWGELLVAAGGSIAVEEHKDLEDRLDFSGHGRKEGPSLANGGGRGKVVVARMGLQSRARMLYPQSASESASTTDASFGPKYGEVSPLQRGPRMRRNTNAHGGLSGSAEEDSLHLEEVWDCEGAVVEAAQVEGSGVSTFQSPWSNVDASANPSISWLFAGQGPGSGEGEAGKIYEGATVVDHMLSAPVQREVQQWGALLPALEDNNVALLVLARLSFRDRFRLRGVCQLWKQALFSEVVYSTHVALNLLEESFAALFLSESGPYLSILCPRSGQCTRLPPIPMAVNVSERVLRITAAGRMVYVYSSEAGSDSLLEDHCMISYDTVTNKWNPCLGQGLAERGKFAAAACDWITGSLFFASNDVSGVALGKNPRCQNASVALWDPRHESWEQCEWLPPWFRFSRLLHASAANGRFLLFLMDVMSGSMKAVQYDPLDKTWNTFVRFPTAQPEVTCLGGEYYGLASGVLWHLREEQESWRAVGHLPRPVDHCRLHYNCSKGCRVNAHCAEALLRLNGQLCALRSWLTRKQEKGNFVVESAIHVLARHAPDGTGLAVPAHAWELVPGFLDDNRGVLAGSGVAIF